MRFDLSGRAPDAKVETASLRVLVKKRVRNPWLWVCQITQDPLRTPPKKIHAEIQKHAILLSGALKAKPEGWMTIRLNARAVERINRAIASKQDRWFAVSLTFE